MNKDKLNPVTALRDLALSIERLATREPAGAASQAFWEETRRELPELDQALASLLQKLIALIGTWTDETALPSSVEKKAQTLAAAVSRGLLEGMSTRFDFLFDRITALLEARAEEVHVPGDRARVAARGLVAGFNEAVNGSGDAVFEKLATRVGRGAVDGVVKGMRAAVERSGMLLLVTGGALFTGGFYLGRRR